ncbi:helix-turn-helix domain-containing protein [Streptomyces sp. NPDC002659]|uniref:helix-turn-helix domain-containing protein n=1 Tax=Streptomyces sp. NPDC002659 TaxID=3364656 RepID=UPI0036C7904E
MPCCCAGCCSPLLGRAVSAGHRGPGLPGSPVSPPGEGSSRRPPPRLGPVWSGSGPWAGRLREPGLPQTLSASCCPAAARFGRDALPGYGTGPGHRRVGWNKPAASDQHRIACSLGRLLAERGVTLPGLAERAGVTVVNLPVASNGRAEAVRASTLPAICAAPDCSPVRHPHHSSGGPAAGCGGRHRPAVRRAVRPPAAVWVLPSVRPGHGRKPL